MKDNFLYAVLLICAIGAWIQFALQDTPADQLKRINDHLEVQIQQLDSMNLRMDTLIAGQERFNNFLKKN